MDATNDLSLTYGAVLLQLAAWASLLLARLGQGTAAQSVLYTLLLACLAAVGSAAAIAVAVGNMWWLPLGTTLALTALGATFDPALTRRHASY